MNDNGLRRGKAFVNIYQHVDGEWMIAAICGGPHDARRHMEALELANPGRRYVIADRLPR